MLSGYTVAIVALGQIDDPQGTFDAAVSRVAVIVLGIVAITFINDALASPSTWRTLLPQLRKAWDGTRSYARETLAEGDLGATRTAALIRKIDAGIVINVGSAFVNMTVLQGCIDDLR